MKRREPFRISPKVNPPTLTAIFWCQSPLVALSKLRRKAAASEPRKKKLAIPSPQSSQKAGIARSTTTQTGNRLPGRTASVEDTGDIRAGSGLGVETEVADYLLAGWVSSPIFLSGSICRRSPIMAICSGRISPTMLTKTA